MRERVFALFSPEQTTVRLSTLSFVVLLCLFLKTFCHTFFEEYLIALLNKRRCFMCIFCGIFCNPCDEVYKNESLRHRSNFFFLFLVVESFHRYPSVYHVEDVLYAH
eukprot:TRINITY_DN499_c0_g1_i3.p1 TRINITY_DN499_c0_g1~~TRINITY_DN499_c0_g1_i3.p1  ORF type:complete len:107 (+),score=5.75 TRINITY_DN499_c0_g1_i3:61-381(+)